MTWAEAIPWLERTSNFAAIMTAVVAVVAYGGYWCDRRSKRRRLENYLRDVKEAGRGSSTGDQGMRSVMHLMARLRMTDNDVLRAGFDSKCIDSRLAKDDENNLATAILFAYRAPAP
jgi:hypothetical protein